jgi:hypothetical protein
MALHTLVVVAALALANWWLHPEDRVLGNILAGLLMLGGYIPWRNYINYLRYADREAYIEVDDNTLWLSNARLGKVAFPLGEVDSFVHRRRPLEVVELRTAKGDELDLRDYEQMDKLIEDLKRSPAGPRYQVQS